MDCVPCKQWTRTNRTYSTSIHNKALQIWTMESICCEIILFATHKSIFMRNGERRKGKFGIVIISEFEQNSNSRWKIESLVEIFLHNVLNCINREISPCGWEKLNSLLKSLISPFPNFSQISNQILRSNFSKFSMFNVDYKLWSECQSLIISLHFGIFTLINQFFWLSRMSCMKLFFHSIKCAFCYWITSKLCQKYEYFSSLTLSIQPLKFISCILNSTSGEIHFIQCHQSPMKPTEMVCVHISTIPNAHMTTKNVNKNSSINMLMWLLIWRIFYHIDSNTLTDIVKFFPCGLCASSLALTLMFLFFAILFLAVTVFWPLL